MRDVNFALNRSSAQQLSLGAFIGLAQVAGIRAVEIRSDIPGREFADGMPAATLSARLQDAGLQVASVNALQRFNAWTEGRATEARHLITYAAGIRAAGVVLCPMIDQAISWSEAEAARNLRQALSMLAPILRDQGVMGYVEPLGMRGSTMKRQILAVEAITDLDAWDCFAICHDTFQFYRCGDDRMFPEHFGICHISGIPRTARAADDLRDDERGFVWLDDRIGTLDQLRHILDAGYSGPASMEAFAPEVQNDPAISAHLVASLDYIRASLMPAAA